LEFFLQEQHFAYPRHGAQKPGSAASQRARIAAGCCAACLCAVMMVPS
jgi:hypothetical protein